MYAIDCVSHLGFFMIFVFPCLGTIRKHCANAILQANAKSAEPNFSVLRRKNHTMLFELLNIRKV